jgi:hypothetical protein
MVTEELQGQRRCPKKQTEVLQWQLAAFRQLPDIPGRCALTDDRPECPAAHTVALKPPQPGRDASPIAHVRTDDSQGILATLG